LEEYDTQGGMLYQVIENKFDKWFWVPSPQNIEYKDRPIMYVSESCEGGEIIRTSNLEYGSTTYSATFKPSEKFCKYRVEIYIEREECPNSKEFKENIMKEISYREKILEGIEEMQCRCQDHIHNVKTQLSDNKKKSLEILEKVKNLEERKYILNLQIEEIKSQLQVINKTALEELFCQRLAYEKQFLPMSADSNFPKEC
jgi:hypothetical protein